MQIFGMGLRTRGLKWVQLLLPTIKFNPWVGGRSHQVQLVHTAKRSRLGQLRTQSMAYVCNLCGRRWSPIRLGLCKLPSLRSATQLYCGRQTTAHTV